jgi:hypothetical protein
MGHTNGVLIADVGHAQALRLRHAQFFFLVFMATFSVFFVESGWGGRIGARNECACRRRQAHMSAWCALY